VKAPNHGERLSPPDRRTRGRDNAITARSDDIEEVVVRGCPLRRSQSPPRIANVEEAGASGILFIDVTALAPEDRVTGIR
jgi:hypothetical protein